MRYLCVALAVFSIGMFAAASTAGANPCVPELPCVPMGDKPPAVVSCEINYGKDKCPYFIGGWTCDVIFDESGNILVDEGSCHSMWWNRGFKKLHRHRF